MRFSPKPIVKKRDNLIIGLVVFSVTLLVYYLTMARSLSFWDAGEYITCGSILGIPHPPGNPFYILLARFMAIISLDIPHAVIINLLSSLLSAFAVMFTYFFTVKFVTMWLDPKKDSLKIYIIGLIAAFYTAFSFTYWNNAIEAEVYSGLAFTINLVVWLTMIWVERSKNFSHQNILLLIIYILFLGFGIHQTSLQIAPAVLFIAVYPMLKDEIKESTFWKRSIAYLIGLIVVYLIFLSIGKTINIPALPKYMFALGFTIILIYHLNDKIDKKTWFFALFFILIGLSTHIFLYIRSEFRPFINEGNPHNLKLFTNYILRRQYGVTSMFVRRATFWFQLKSQFLKYFSWQFFNAETLSRWLKTPQIFMQIISNLLVSFLGLAGIWHHFKKNKHSFAYLFSFFFMASIAMVFVINLSDSEVRERDYFFVTAYNFWTVWMAIGSIGLIELISPKKKILKIIAAVVILSLPIINLASQYHIHDRSKEYIALDYGQNILNSVDENAIVFTNGDNDTFPVWYAQAVKDPAATEYIPPKPESIEKLKQIKNKSNALINPTEKTKKIVKRAMEFKNEHCDGIRTDVTIANLSLLNTPWYIRQLRDHEGVEFNIPDKHIELCQESPASALYPRKIPKDVRLKIEGTIPGDEFYIKFKKGTVLYVKDLAVIQIIKDNYGKRPIYFAVTTPTAIGFKDHLQNEGMVDRVVKTKGKQQFDLDRLTTNIDSVYSYRAIFDDSVYKDKNMKRLLNNYGAAYMRASQYAHSVQKYDIAIHYLEKAITFIERKSDFYASLSKLYLEASFYFLENQNNDKAFNYLEKAISYKKSDATLVEAVYHAVQYSKEYEKGLKLLNSIKEYQDSSIVENYINKINSLRQ